MKKILVINPNSSEQMSQDIMASFARQNITNVTVESTPGAPHVLESFADYTLAGVAVMEKLRKYPTDFPYDGVLLACMGDPSLYAIKERCPVPVVGIAEAAISTALLLGARFSIIAASEKAKPMMESMVMSYGLENRLASVETLGATIDEFMQDINKLRNGIKRADKSARSKGAEVLLLGCAGMTMIGEELGKLTDIPAIDPVVAGYWQLDAILNAGYDVSRIGLYAKE